MWLRQVLLCHQKVVYLLFDCYAALGTSGTDIFNIGFNSFGLFVGPDFGLIDKKSKSCKAADFDQLYIAIDASNMSGKIVEKHKRKKTLNRREWLQAVVQMAVMRYVLDGDVDDVSTAVQAFLANDIAPKLDPALATPPNETREALCYNEEVDDVLRAHEAALQKIYARACVLSGTSMSGGLANKLVSYANWKDFLKLFKLVDTDLNERDAQLVFVWARMHYIDEQNDKSRIKWTHLCFEDFLEALCRIARLKAFPTDKELAAAECAHAPAYLVQLEETDPAAYDAFMERAAPWGQPLSRDRIQVHRAVEHLCHLLCYQVQGGRSQRSATDWNITATQVERFMVAGSPG